MREFTAAVEDIEAEEAREAKIVALIEEGKTREEAEQEVDAESYVEFKLDDRVMRAYKPTGGQLIFMLASLGRGQTTEQRFAAIVNIMISSLRGSDADYLESRLLTRDRKQRLEPERLEGIFEYLTEEWFRSDVPGDGASVPDRR